MEEIWTPIITWSNNIKYDFTGYYNISTLGRIKSIRKEKILKLQLGKSDYYIINLHKNSLIKTFSVHKCVYESFHGKIPEGMQVNHINEDIHDNRLENLNLMTPKENTNWGTGIERKTLSQRNNNRSKIVLQYSLEGNFIKEFPSTKEVQRQFGYANTNIGACCLGKRKSAYGYIWRYKNEDNCLPS